MRSVQSQQPAASPVVGLIMGSKSDWETMQHCATELERFDIAHETRVVSAHRTPDLMHEYGRSAAGRGLQVVIAAAGGAAHLPGMIAGLTPLPVIGVPIQSKALHGIDSLLSIAQMPGGVPVATMAIGKAGAINAAIFAARILGNYDKAIRCAVDAYVVHMRDEVIAIPDPRFAE